MSEFLKDQMPQLNSYSVLNSSSFESTLCFTKDIFYADSFDVDSFLAHYKRDYSLERLKNDLNIFLKVLELSMSDLINKDYPDFVNLSTNLVDLDKSINALKLPLETIKSEVDEVKNGIDNEVNQIMSKLNEKLIIEKKRIVLKLLMNWQRSLKMTNEMIDTSNPQNVITGDHLERISFEFCQLKNSLTICSGDVGGDNSKQNDEINKLSEMLLKKMQELFVASLTSKECGIMETTDGHVQLKHVLKSYGLLSMQRQAEQLFTETCVKPYMNNYINEEYLMSNGRSLDGVFEKVLEFYELNFNFLKIVGEIKKSSQQSANFDFTLNSIWSTVAWSFDIHLSQIFSPADPDMFHQRYLAAIHFIQNFETKSAQFNDPDFKMRLRCSQSFKFFIKKWPIHVYFQIRFQEIVLRIEEDFYNHKQLLPDPDTDDLNFNLKTTHTVFNQLEYCWKENANCFLKPLLSHFWKLSLQIISRYQVFYLELYQKKLALLEKKSMPIDQFNQLLINENASSSTPNSAQPIENSSEMANQLRPISNHRVKTPTDFTESSSSENILIEDIEMAVLTLLDISKLHLVKLPNFFDAVVSPVVRSVGGGTKSDTVGVLKDAFSASLFGLSQLEAIVNEYIVEKKAGECSEFLKNVNDIARLYRRTNRDAPKTASVYVGSAVQVIADFKETYAEETKASRQKELVGKCIRNIIDSVCIKYQAVSSDLLESVKKMEDSLKVLHRVRQSKSTAANMSSMSTAAVITDDDKIRLQLVLDITEFGSLLEQKFSYKGDSNYESLYELVKEVKIIQETNNESA